MIIIFLFVFLGMRSCDVLDISDCAQKLSPGSDCEIICSAETKSGLTKERQAP